MTINSLIDCFIWVQSKRQERKKTPKRSVDRITEWTGLNFMEEQTTKTDARLHTSTEGTHSWSQPQGPSSLQTTG